MPLSTHVGLRVVDVTALLLERRVDVNPDGDTGSMTVSYALVHVLVLVVVICFVIFFERHVAIDPDGD